MGCARSGERPSMVVTCLEATLETGVEQERIGCPSIWTVHAPQSAIPQPNLVPVMPSVSRRTHRSGIVGTTSTVWGLPFSVKRTTAMEQPRAGSLGLHARVYFTAQSGT